MLECNDVNMNAYGHRLYHLMDSPYNEDEFLGSFKNIYSVTNNVKLRDFQYHLILGKIFVNKILYKWGLVTSDKCEYCGSAVQTIMHLLVDCPYARDIWNDIVSLLPIEIQKQCTWKKKKIFLNTVHDKVQHGINQMVLMCKYFIFQQKCLFNKYNLSLFRRMLTENYYIQAYNADIDGRTNKNMVIWRPVFSVLIKI